MALTIGVLGGYGLGMVRANSPDDAGRSAGAACALSRPFRLRSERLESWLARCTARACWYDLIHLSAWRSLGWDLDRFDPPSMMDVLTAAGVTFEGGILSLLSAVRLAGYDATGAWSVDLWRLAVIGAAVDRARGDFLGGRPSGLRGVPLPLRVVMPKPPTVTRPANDCHGLAASLRRLACALRQPPPFDRT